MSKHHATVEWNRNGSDFRYEAYSRAHMLRFSGRAPSEDQHRALHQRAHEKCFIANSVKTEVVVEPC